jgi:hypothetical protein
MVAPNFKKLTDTNPDNPSIYGASDLRYAFDVLDGTHPTDRIQASVIEGLQQTCNAIVQPEGSNFVARNVNGAVLYSGTDAQTALQTAFNQAGHIYIGPGTYNTTSTLTCTSNTHIEADMTAVIRGAPSPNSHPIIKNSNILTPPAIGNSYIILEGGTWDGNSADDTIHGNIANINFENVEFVWVNRVRSIKGVSEGIKVKGCDRAWITNNYSYFSKLESDGTGKAGIMASLINRDCIIANNIIDDSGGEAIGAHTDCDRLIIANNICRYRTRGRCYILLEGTSTDSQYIRDCVITGNAVSSKYQCINITSSNGVVISNNTLTNVGAGDAVGQASASGDGIRLNGINHNITIVGNYIHEVEYHGMLFINECDNLLIANNMIENVGSGASNTYDGITFNISGPYSNVKISGNQITDTRGTHLMRHGIRFQHNGQDMSNVWVHDNQIYGELGNTITLWTGNGRFTKEARFFNNSGFNSQGKITNPFNNTHNEVGIPKASTSQFTYAAAPSASTTYTVVMSPVSITSTGGSGVQIVVEEPGGNNMVTDASSLSGLYLPVGWRITWGAFSSAPTVHVVGL